MKGADKNGLENVLKIVDAKFERALQKSLASKKVSTSGVLAAEASSKKIVEEVASAAETEAAAEAAAEESLNEAARQIQEKVLAKQKPKEEFPAVAVDINPVIKKLASDGQEL